MVSRIAKSAGIQSLHGGARDKFETAGDRSTGQTLSAADLSIQRKGTDASQRTSMNARTEMIPDREKRAVVKLLRSMGSGLSPARRVHLPRFEVTRRADRVDEDFVFYLIYGDRRAELGSFKRAEAIGLQRQITAAGMDLQWINIGRV